MTFPSSSFTFAVPLQRPVQRDDVLAEPLLFGLRPAKPVLASFAVSAHRAPGPAISPAARTCRSLPVRLPPSLPPADLQACSTLVTRCQAAVDLHLAQISQSAAMQQMAREGHRYRRKVDARRETEHAAHILRRKGKIVLLGNIEDSDPPEVWEDAQTAMDRYALAEGRQLGGTGLALRYIRQRELAALQTVISATNESNVRLPVDRGVVLQPAALALGAQDGPLAHSTPPRPMARLSARSQSGLYSGSPRRFPTPARLHIPLGSSTRPARPVQVSAMRNVVFAPSAPSARDLPVPKDASADESDLSTGTADLGVHLERLRVFDTADQSGVTEADADDEAGGGEFDQTFSELSVNGSWLNE